MAAIALCEQSLAIGVPVLQNMARALWRNSGGNIGELDEMSRKDPIFWRAATEIPWQQMLLRGFEFREPTDSARDSFAKAFQLSPSEQRDWEHYLDGWTCTFGEPVHVAPVFDPFEWRYEEFPLG